MPLPLSRKRYSICRTAFPLVVTRPTGCDTRSVNARGYLCSLYFTSDPDTVPTMVLACSGERPACTSRRVSASGAAAAVVTSRRKRQSFLYRYNFHAATPVITVPPPTTVSSKGVASRATAAPSCTPSEAQSHNHPTERLNTPFATGLSA